MANIVLLNNVDHHDLRVRLDHGAAFGDAVNLVRVFPTEFEELAREYPILFRRAADGYEAHVLLGLDRDENLFLDGTHWQARYVPALRQRGPFSIRSAATADAEPLIDVDLDSPRIAVDAAGEPVFLPHGGNAPYLDHVAAVLRRIHVGHLANASMFAALEGEGLIEPVALEITIDEARRYDLADFSTIGAEALDSLDGDALERLHRAGFLRPAFAAAASLGNIARLIDLKARRAA